MTLRTEYVNVNLNVTLRKELHANEVLCSYCGGTGLRIDNHAFRLPDEVNVPDDPFPHVRQTLTVCPYCYDGIQERCNYCGNTMGRKSWCDCDEYQRAISDERHKKEWIRWNEATKVSVRELRDSNRDAVLYLEDFDTYLKGVDGLLNFLADRVASDELNLNDFDRIRIYRTHTHAISLDAKRILENVADDLSDYAYESVMKRVDELQGLLNQFVRRFENETLTYFPDYKNGVIVTANDLRSFTESNLNGGKAS